MSGDIIRNKRNDGNAPSGFAVYAKAARKYNFEAPTLAGRHGQVIRKKLHPNGDTSESEVAAQDVANDSEYVVPVTIGTPGVTLKLDLDTGSSDLWVYSSEMGAPVDVGSGPVWAKGDHTIYDPKKSSTAKALHGHTWSITYGDSSSASGNVYTDVVKIGSVTVPSQAVELAEKMSSQFAQDSGSDGLLGLAWPSLNTVVPQPQKTPVQNLIDGNILQSGVFTVALDKGDENSFYTFGFIDAARAGVSESDIKYTPVDNKEGFWMFDSPSVIINGKKIHRPAGTRAIADTGTTLCLVEDSVAKAVYSSIPGAKLDHEQGGYIYPEDATVPSVQLAVGNHLISINPENFALVSGDGMMFGGIQPRGNMSFDIFGDVFLKNAYTIFDQVNLQIGVAQRGSSASS